MAPSWKNMKDGTPLQLIELLYKGLIQGVGFREISDYSSRTAFLKLMLNKKTWLTASALAHPKDTPLS